MEPGTRACIGRQGRSLDMLTSPLGGGSAILMARARQAQHSLTLEHVGSIAANATCRCHTPRATATSLHLTNVSRDTGAMARRGHSCDSMRSASGNPCRSQTPPHKL